MWGDFVVELSRFSKQALALSTWLGRENISASRAWFRFGERLLLKLLLFEASCMLSMGVSACDSLVPEAAKMILISNRSWTFVLHGGLDRAVWLHVWSLLFFHALQIWPLLFFHALQIWHDCLDNFLTFLTCCSYNTGLGCGFSTSCLNTRHLGWRDLSTWVFSARCLSSCGWAIPTVYSRSYFLHIFANLTYTRSLL